MRTYVVAFLLALAVAAALTPLVERLARRFSWLDRPNESRKVHTRAVPRIGGIAVVTAFLAPIIGLIFHDNEISDLLYAEPAKVLGLTAGATAIVALGIFDDLKGADARVKLVVQTSVAVGMWFAGFSIERMANPFGPPFQLGVLSLPATVLWIVAIVNALNLIDGLDGLASGVALFATLVLFVVSFNDHAVLLCLMTATLCGSLVGFLFFNFNPARIFLGDSGSMFLGFCLAVISLWTQRKGAAAVALLIPTLALALPILDTSLSFVRRIARGKNPFRADREHLHHRLLELGLSHRSAVLTLYVASGIFALGGLALLDNDTTRRAIALAAVGVSALLFFRRVGLLSLPTPKQDAIEQKSDIREEVRDVTRAIRLATSAEGMWRQLCRSFPLLGVVDEARLSLLTGDLEETQERQEVVYHWREGASPEGTDWSLDQSSPRVPVLRLPLVDQGQRLGELRVLFREGARYTSALGVDRVWLELLKEAVVDFQANARESHTSDARVFRIAQRSSHDAA
jgi:UDP-GlcNAc:undecaprenyl-phosphate/decaprenyl-phosphate GlcNAc-1-phosphate transferase